MSLDMGRILRGSLAALAAIAAGCASLPSPEGRIASNALEDSSQTRLGRAVAPFVAAHPGKTGIHALFEPRDAFAARVLLAAAAEKSIDAQYYIWHGDTVGNLVFESLRKAAGRGVRVRLLLDDMNTAGLDPVIAALDAHPNIEVRLYNPFAHRGARTVDFLTDFSRVNRRMHNKSFTVDNQASVVGGRNIGNEYYGAGEGTVFADLDVIAVGAAVRDVSRQFDRFWNSASAYPAASLVAGAAPADLDARFAATRAGPEPSPTSRPFAPRRSCMTCSPGGCRSSGRTPGSCTTTRRRRSMRRPAPTSCFSRRWWRRSAGRRSRSTSSRPTSCRATKAPRPWRPSPAGA